MTGEAKNKEDKQAGKKDAMHWYWFQFISSRWSVYSILQYVSSWLCDCGRGLLSR